VAFSKRRADCAPPLIADVRQRRFMNAADVSVEFQRRRSRTWKATRWWVLTALLAGAAFAFGPHGSDRDMTQGQFTFMLVCFIIVGVAMIVTIRTVHALYRCPRCNNTPMSPMGGSGISFRIGVDLNPSTCSRCGAQLRAGA
jgi:hypothetical protein